MISSGFSLCVFCLGGSAHSSTWQKLTLWAPNYYFALTSMTVRLKILCLLRFYADVSLGKWGQITPWFHSDLRHLLRRFRHTGVTFFTQAPSRDYIYYIFYPRTSELIVSMKVTVTFGDTSVVVPCKDGWTVRDLIEQAMRRYRRILEQVMLKRCSNSSSESLCCFVFFGTLSLHRVYLNVPA